jgi:DNA-binding MarR family transcriptional regulator
MPKTKPTEYILRAGTNPEVKASMKSFLDIGSIKTWRAFMEAYRSVCAYLDSALHESGQSCPRFQIFFRLYFIGPHSASELAREQDVTRGNMSMFLKRLLNEKQVETFSASGSSKRKLFRLSKKGRKDFELYFPKHVERVKSVVPSLDSKTLKVFDEMASAGRQAKERMLQKNSLSA